MNLDVKFQTKIDSLKPETRKNVYEVIDYFKSCNSQPCDQNGSKENDLKSLKRSKNPKKTYIPLVGDPAYNFRREVKERFFQN